MVLNLLKLDGGNYKFVNGSVRIWVSKNAFPGGVAPATIDASALGLAQPAPKALKAEPAPAPAPAPVESFDAGIGDELVAAAV
jgi:hypothetical protein